MIALLPILSRVWPYLAGTALIIAALLWIDHRGYQRAKDDRAKADAALIAIINDRFGEIDVKLSTDLARVDRTETIVKPTLIREISREPRLSDPTLGLSDDIVREINAARATSCPASTDCGTMPAAANAN